MSNSEYILNHKGRWVIDTHHATARMHERGIADANTMHRLYRQMVDKIMGMKTYHRLAYNTEFFVWFRELQQGMIVAHRRDTCGVNSGKKLHFFLVTVLPQGDVVDANRHKRIVIK